MPKHFLPPVVRLCGKLEMLDRLLPKLKATNHRVLMHFLLQFKYNLLILCEIVADQLFCTRLVTRNIKFRYRKLIWGKFDR